MKLSIFLLTFCLIYVSSQPTEKSIEILGEDASEQLEQLVKSIKLEDISDENGDIKLYIKNMKVTGFNMGSVNLVDGGDGTYRADLDGLSASIEADVRGVKEIGFWILKTTVDASVHVKASLSDLEFSQAVTLNMVDDQLKADVGACVSRVGDVDYDIQGKDFWGNLVALISKFVKGTFKGIIKNMASDKICPTVRPEIQKILDSININEIMAEMMGGMKK